MKSLIIIGTYCPDNERKKLLFDLLVNLQIIRESFDILVTSHTKIPDNFLDKIDYFFYDRENELITDLKYVNQPWFSPSEGQTIFSTYVTGYSTYLAVYRLFIGGLGLAKTMGYSKIHWLEYDSHITNFNEFFDNDMLLNEYGAINYKKEYKNFEKNLAWGIGNFMSLNIEKTDNNLLYYNRENLLKLIENHQSKTNERVTEEIISNSLLYSKSYQLLVDNGFKLNLSENTSKDENSIWAVPYYEEKNNKINFVCWNDKYETPINVSVIVNGDKIITFKNVNKFQYYLDELGDYDKIYNILVIVNDKIKLKIDFNQIDKETFKKTNFLRYE